MSQQRIERLRNEAAKLEERRTYLENWQAHIRPLSDFTLDEQLSIFTELYRQCFEYLGTWVRKGYEPKDGDHYLYEALLGKMLGEEVWAIIRRL